MDQSTYKILLVEENRNNADRVIRQLKTLDIKCKIRPVDSRTDFESFIENNSADLIISNFNFSQLNGFRLLEFVRDSHSNLPIILISSSGSEEQVVNSMRKGASDYIKMDNLERLNGVVKRELMQYRQHQVAQIKLRNTQKQYESLIQSIDGIVWEADAETFEFLYVSPQSQNILGYPPEAWYDSKTFWKDHIVQEDRERAVQYCHRKTTEGENHEFQYRMTAANGHVVWIRDYVTVLMEDGEPTRLRGIMVDVTKHVKVEQERDKATRKLRERVKEQKCLYNISNINEQKFSIPHLLQKAVMYLPPGFQYPEITEASIEFNGEVYQTEKFVEKEEMLTCSSSEIETSDLIIKVIYLEERSESDKSVFLKEEEHLLNSITETLSLKVNRILIQNELIKKQETLEKTYEVAKIGNWELDLESNEVFWSSKTKEIYELPEDYNPTAADLENLSEQSPDKERISQALEKAISIGESYDIEVRTNTGNNNEKWIRTIGQPEFKDGKCVRIYGSIQDIDKRKKAEEALQKSEQRFKSLVQDGTDLISIIDSEGVYKYVSPTTQRVQTLGMESEEFIGLRSFDFIHENDRGRVRKAIAELETGERREIKPYRFKNAKEEWRWLESTITNMTDTPAVNGYVSNSRDVTDRIEQEKKMRQIVEHSTNLFYKHDVDHKLQYISPQSYDFVGLTPEQCMKKWTELVTDHPKNRVGFKKTEKAISTGESQGSYELQLKHADGGFVWARVHEAPVVENGKTVAIVGSLTDITEQKKYEQQLEESVNRYEIVTKATSDVIWDVDFEADSVTYNSNICNVFGYKKTEVESSRKWWLSKIHPDDRQLVREHFRSAETSKTDRLQIEYRFECADGSYKFVNDRAYIITNEDGKVVRMIGAMQDITKQKVENLWLKLLESAIANTTESIAIIEANTSGPGKEGREILYVNSAFEKMTGSKKSDLLGRSLLTMMGPSTNSKEIGRILSSLDAGKACETEVTYQTNGNDEYWAHISFAPVKDNSGQHSHWICIGRDVTERRNRLSDLRDSLQEKETLLMEIHHRVKNNLAVVSSMMQLQALDEVDTSLQKKLYDSVARIRTMVTIHEMLYESGSFSKLDFSVNLRKLVSMIIETIQNQVSIDVVFNCDEVELNVNQAIPSSLIVNETVTNCIKHAFKNREKGQITINLYERDNLIEIKVIDNGVGFSTGYEKPDTSTLGLQLIDVLSKQMDATYHFQQVHGNGTEFSIQFEKTVVKGIGNAYLN